MKILSVALLIPLIPLTVMFYACMVLSAYYLIRHNKYELTQEKMDETAKSFWSYVLLVLVTSGVSGALLQTVFG